ncbi:hypothetical protein P3T73_03820 [Kiritimatiellota bacterium B12222]|nr:hypothetical protein P3T73_03820 [Kiritimatiellota bacterium B12222]
MNKWILTIAFLCLSLTRVSAQEPEYRLGFGILAGEPSGISLLLNMTDVYSLQGAVAYTFEDSEEERLQYQLDWIMHLDTSNNDNLVGPYRGYIGMGMLYKSEADQAQDVYGLRIPFGVVIQSEGLPFQFFFELVPVMNVSPSTDFDFNAGIGLQFLFL